jgi:poly(3-hydroxybutyrate) depolymerase
MRFSGISLVAWTLATIWASGCATAASRKLPAAGADPARTSVSGLSSGAFMAIQYGVAFSGNTIGMGVIAGGPYNCVYVNAGGIDTCMTGNPDGAASYAAAQGLADRGQIDPVSNLTAQKIYLFSGTKDDTVKQTVMNAVLAFFQSADVPASNVQYVRQYPAGHAFISPSSGNACGATAAPYVNRCAVAGSPGAGGTPDTYAAGGTPDTYAAGGTPDTYYDQPGAVLTQIYGPLTPPASALSAKPVAFDQTEFISPERSTMSSMAETGYVYIPASCAQGGSEHCAVHVVFHGCQQGAATVRGAVYSKVGYNNWADSNGIIVLYPQAVVSSFIPYNPQGCWDWWGYSGLDFQVRSGIQLAAVRAMVNRLTTPAK